MLQVKEGLPLVRFGTLIETPLNCLIVLKDGPIKTLADLKGKKVGYSVASFQDAYLSAILKIGRPHRRRRDAGQRQLQPGHRRCSPARSTRRSTATAMSS